MSVTDLNNKANNKDFGERVKFRRAVVGLTQSGLARKIGAAKSTIQTYEAGALPKGENIIKLTGALKCTADWLLTGRGAPDPDQGGYYGDQKIDLLDIDCVNFLMIEAQKETNIVLTAYGLQRMTGIILDDGVWGEFKQRVAEVLRAVTKAAPSWTEQDVEEPKVPLEPLERGEEDKEGV